ncbi:MULTISPECIES: sigma factor-like helix-turn-helix DNA-binding protein [Streptomycetaceae]|uniref:sigma factor-like helix-turn-helix DNA-binding protein n=1 Tax=Streptomycetaceae TaxID=2062 RepID=UPI0012FF957C|nr:MULTISPECIES: sigma factor-like helix-turn-helix DNA-binding protein [Streptomycetaceae]MYS61418.1 RNA polymerase subunit sigma-24 [Streptomyces sp. SID5468]
MTEGRGPEGAVVGACLDALASARSRHEAYVGPWLPEPVLTVDGPFGPLEDPALRESVSLPWLVRLERLTPAERAVLVLHETYGRPLPEIAGLLRTTPQGCEGLLRSARQRTGLPRVRHETGWDERRRVLEEFLAAAVDGDLAGAAEFLSQDVVAWADGGGVIDGAARRPVLGAEKAARYVSGVLARAPRSVLELSVAEVNSEPSAVAVLGTAVVGVLVPEFGPDGIVGLRNVLNPHKLEFIGRQWARLPTG